MSFPSPSSSFFQDYSISESSSSSFHEASLNDEQNEADNAKDVSESNALAKMGELQLDLELLPGETLLAAEKSLGIEFLDFISRKRIPGFFFFTNYQFIFAHEDTRKSWKTFLKVPYGNITKIEKLPARSNNSNSLMEVKCKDFRKCRFDFKNLPNIRSHVEEILLKMSFPTGITSVFAFSHRYPSNSNGWGVFNIFEEFLRQQVDFNEWRICDSNHDYHISESYPSKFVVPRNITDEDLEVVAQFRSKGRIPALCWMHPVKGTVITRSSQPFVGLNRTRCPTDEDMLRAIAGKNGKLCILDARPRTNAMTNQVIKGMGYENTDTHYKHCTLEFLNIGNIHVMRDSLNKVDSLCQSCSLYEEDRWLSRLESTHWLDHIKLILIGSKKVVDILENGQSILLHCSDGWDRTAQLSGIAQIILDPFYRTITGFEVLIEKEWTSFGHKFSTRTGQASKAADDDQRSPIFLQFLDCVHQLLSQFPCSFEYNNKFLIQIMDCVYNCKFGNFLYDNEKEREMHQVTKNTPSLWAYVDDHREEYTNIFYMPDPNVLRVSHEMQDLCFWKSYYLRYHKPKHTILSKEIRCEMFKTLYEKSLEEITELKKEIEKLKSQPS